MRSSLSVPFVALALSACQEAVPPAPPAAPAKPAAAPASDAAPGRLRRAEVDQVLVQQGPPWILRRVLSEEVMARDGKFAGWRLVGLPEEWRAIDLKPGDVVMRVNGLPLETPDQAFEAWKSVAKYPAIKIALMRDGATREVTIPIEGAPSADTLKLLGRETPAQRVSAPAPRQGPVQLGGQSGTPDDEAY